MPLIKTVLEQGLKTPIQTELEAKLKTEFKKPEVKQSLRKLLDGDSAAGVISSAKNISKALSNIKLGIDAMAKTPADKLSPSAAESLVKKFTANEWANAISECVSEWMSETIAPILAKQISDIISKNVANQVDSYIKTATIITPPGQLVATSSGAGSTTTPSTPAIIS
jgi:hypothetical protein